MNKQKITILNRQAREVAYHTSLAGEQLDKGNLKEAKDELRHAANILHEIDYALYEMLNV